MSPFTFAAVMLYRAGEKLFEKKVNWKDVEVWIRAQCIGDAGRGYIGNHLSTAAPSNRFVELILDEVDGTSVRLTAALYFDQRSIQPSSKKVWTARSMDKELRKRFNNNLRIRINV